MTFESASCSILRETPGGDNLTIYLDNMAATPIDPRVAERHRAEMLAHVGNAHSTEHAFGVKAQSAIDEAASTLLAAIASPAEQVTFTPGASSALWLAVEDAIARANGRPAVIAATAVEHPALLSAIGRAEADGRARLVKIPVDGTAAPCVDAVQHVLAQGVDFVCTMAANNEVGTITDLAAITAMTRAAGARHLVDASQAAGRVDFTGMVAADLVVVSGAKVYGPRRAGALIGKLTRHADGLAHDLFGSPDAATAIALAFSLLLSTSERHEELRVARMRDLLEARLFDTVPGLVVNGDRDHRLAGCLHVSTPHIPGEAAVARLWGRLAVSTGAACQSGAPGPSHVLTAMGMPAWASEGAVRIGIGRLNTEEEVDQAAELLSAALHPELSARRVA
jgi:cysteine desulfurase